MCLLHGRGEVRRGDFTDMCHGTDMHSAFFFFFKGCIAFSLKTVDPLHLISLF